MAAYVIFLRDRITDQGEMNTYAGLAAKARGDHPLSALVFYGPSETWEGETVDGVVVIKFPDAAAAHAWYDSPEYQAAKAHRLKGADYRVVMVEGLPEPS